MNIKIIISLFFIWASYFFSFAEELNGIRRHVPLDSILLSDPAILADNKTQMYYMTGTGGKLWKSKDLKYWDGPYSVIEISFQSWMGKNPEVWAAELHEFDGKY